MSWRHITGLCAILLALLACGLSNKCDAERMKDMKEVALVFGAGIIGDANGQTKSRGTIRSATGKHKTLEGSDER